MDEPAGEADMITLQRPSTPEDREQPRVEAEIFSRRLDGELWPDDLSLTAFWERISYDVKLFRADGSEEVYRDVQGTEPRPEPETYEVVASPTGTPVGLSWRGTEIRFYIGWLPRVTECEE